MTARHIARHTFLSEAQLLLAAAIWGFAFVAQRVAMEHVGPFTFNAVRFALGSLAVLLVMRLRRKRRGAASVPRPGFGTRDLVLVTLLAGAVLFLGASLQQMGLVYTTAGKAGFITGLYVVIVPILGLAWRQRPGHGVWAGAAVAAIGLFLLSVSERLTISLGDSLVLAAAFFWAGHVLVIGWLTKRIAPLRLACLQFAVCSALSLVAALLLEEIQLGGLLGGAVPILYGGILSVGIAYTLQVVAQRKAPPAYAAIVLSLEAVFAVLGGWMLLSESLTGRQLAGCALMLGGVLLAQWRPSRALRARAAHGPALGDD